MSYLEELKARYKAARARMGMTAPSQPVISLPEPTQKSPEPPPPVKRKKRPGLISEKSEKDIVCKALRITNIDSLDPSSQAYNMAHELINSPRLPVLPGLVLDETGAVRWMRILHAVAQQHNLKPEDIIGESRRRCVIVARHEVFYRLRMDLAMSYTKIGGLFRRDHSTVMHGINKIRKRLLDEIKRQADDQSSPVVTHLTTGDRHSSLMT